MQSGWNNKHTWGDPIGCLQFLQMSQFFELLFLHNIILVESFATDFLLLILVFSEMAIIGIGGGTGCCCSMVGFSLLSNMKKSCLIYQRKGRVAEPGRVSYMSLRVVAEVNFVNAEEAKELVGGDGYVVIDVRDKSQYERAHIKSSCHVPLFIENQDNDIGTIVKRQLHNNFSGLFYGLPFTKPNPEFAQSIKSQFSPDTKLLLVCQEGLRSAAAASKLEQAGFQNISCITSGLQSVKPGTFESVGKTELKDAGKAGLVTIQGKISAVLGTVLVCAYLFIQFFPEQAEKLLALAPS